MSPEIAELIQSAKTIAVIGLSGKAHRPSHGVAAYLQRQGYRIVPVNPNETTVLGERVYPTLESACRAVGDVDIVDVFRRSSEAGKAVDAAIACSAKLIWLQLGVVNRVAAERARQAGIPIVMDRCLLVEHRALTGG